MRYQQQLQLLFTPRDATPVEHKAWQEGDRTWWADRALHFVAIASVVQVVMLGLMLLSYWGINSLANG